MNTDFEEALAKRLFSRLDVDQDGLISHHDINFLLKQLSIPTSINLVEQIHKGIDINKKGRINMSDFKRFYDERHRTLKKLFDAIEANHEKFGQEEIKSILAKINIEVSEHQIKQILNFVPSGKYTSLTFDHFKDIIFLLPQEHIASLFDHFQRASAIDLGESITIPSDEPTSPSTPIWTTLLSGAVAGGISRTITAPLDRVKIILQTQRNSHFTLIKIVKKIYWEEGWSAFFRGNGTNVIKICPETAIKFLAYERFKKFFCKDSCHPRTRERLLAGGLAGVSSQLLIYPLEIAKTRLALAPRKYYKGIFDCLYNLGKKEGFKSLYKGLTVSVMGIIPYASVDLTVYNSLRDAYTNKIYKEPTSFALLACGAISSICGQTISYPLVVIRTRLQAVGIPGIEAKYEGIIDCASKIRKYEGIRGFYRGLVPNFLKSVPAISISYVVFEKCREALTGVSGVE